MKKGSPYGYAPKRSRRSRLNDAGYQKVWDNGNSTFSEKEAKAIVARLHAKGLCAQALHIRGVDYPQSWWIVMYKKKKKGGK